MKPGVLGLVSLPCASLLRPWLSALVEKSSPVSPADTCALALEGTVERPHFDRAAFKVARIYATLAGDGRSANFRFRPDEQEFKYLLAPNVFSPNPNGWGRQGWTTARLSEMTEQDLVDALRTAWAHARPNKREP